MFGILYGIGTGLIGAATILLVLSTRPLLAGKGSSFWFYIYGALGCLGLSIFLAVVTVVLGSLGIL